MQMRRTHVHRSRHGRARDIDTMRDVRLSLTVAGAAQVGDDPWRTGRFLLPV
jgi:hypothetical protein